MFQELLNLYILPLSVEKVVEDKLVVDKFFMNELLTFTLDEFIVLRFIVDFKVIAPSWTDILALPKKIGRLALI